MTCTCGVCFHRCRLAPGQRGFCGVRENQKGTIVSLNYGKATALALDPIEKKPLSCFHPNSSILSYGSYGCNLRCPFCQNHDISWPERPLTSLEDVSPEDLAALAAELQPRGNIGVAFTYNEPLIAPEFLLDTAQLLHRRGLVSVAVTNGSVTEETAAQVLPALDALNIDLKGFTQAYYQRLGGDLETVKTFIRLAVPRCHVELTTLVIPGENDSEMEMDALAAWVASLDPALPLHISRFFPRWQMTDRTATPLETIHRLADVARRHLSRVFLGNC